jgi:hypothetical protein
VRPSRESASVAGVVLILRTTVLKLRTECNHPWSVRDHRFPFPGGASAAPTVRVTCGNLDGGQTWATHHPGTRIRPGPTPAAQRISKQACAGVMAHLAQGFRRARR